MDILWDSSRSPGRLGANSKSANHTIGNNPPKNFAIHSRAGCAAAPASQAAVSGSLCGNVDSKWWRCCRARSERVRLKREAEWRILLLASSPTKRLQLLLRNFRRKSSKCRATARSSTSPFNRLQGIMRRRKALRITRTVF